MIDKLKREGRITDKSNQAPSMLDFNLRGVDQIPNQGPQESSMRLMVMVVQWGLKLEWSVGEE